MIPIHVQNQTILVPTASNSCDVWTGYYAQLKDLVGQEYARQLWLYTWDQAGSASCLGDTVFVKWANKQGLQIGNEASRALNSLSSMGNNLLGMGKTITGISRFAVPAAAVLILVLLVFLLPKLTQKTSLSQLAMLTPYGRGAAVVKNALKP